MKPNLDKGGIRYYPNFEEKHFYIKEQFDFFAEVFFYMIIGALDNITYLLETYYQLKIDSNKGRWEQFIKQLKKVNPHIAKCIIKIKSETRYNEIREIRNKGTHHFSPNTIDSGIEHVNEKTINIGAGKYTKSSEMISLAQDAIDILEQTLLCIKNNIP